MSLKTVQTLLATVLSFIFLVTVYRLGRRQFLSFRYTVGWMFLGVLGVLAGLLTPFAAPIANNLKISPSALLGLGAVILLVTLCVQLSISISGMQQQIRRLAEEAAFLREEIDELTAGEQ